MQIYSPLLQGAPKRAESEHVCVRGPYFVGAIVPVSGAGLRLVIPQSTLWRLSTQLRGRRFKVVITN